MGGAVAVLFYAEPVRTHYLDVFVLLDEQAEASLTPLAGIYQHEPRELLIGPSPRPLLEARGHPHVRHA